MITKVQRGRGVRNLLAYLYGPGKANEHTNPHIVAGFAPTTMLEPAVGASGRLELSRLTAMLEANVHAAGRYDSKHLWHCSVAIEAEAGLRSDAEWAEVARAIVAETGIAVDGDANGCSWVAVRHGVSTGGNDHIHIVATLAHPDGTAERAPNDYRAVGRVARRFELEWGTTVLDRHAGSAPPAESRAELEKAERLQLHAEHDGQQVPGGAPATGGDGRPRGSRSVLREAAQSAAAAASSFEEFRADLEARGLLVTIRESVEHPGQVTGYALAIPGDVDAAGRPVAYGGSKLAGDLSYPALQKRWASHEGWGVERRQLSRRELVATMRECAAASPTREAYLQALQDAGVEVRLRHSTRTGEVGGEGAASTGEITGYAVRASGAAADDRRFEGAGRLDPSLSWQQLPDTLGRQLAPAGAELGDRTRAAVRLRMLEHASTTSTLEDFLAGLRGDGLLVETTQDDTSGRITAYRVGPGELAPQRGATGRADGSAEVAGATFDARYFGADLTPQRLSMAWTGERIRYHREQREQLERLALSAVKQSTQVVRRAVEQDPQAAVGVAGQARDLLETMARAAEQHGSAGVRAGQHLQHASRTFDRAARDLGRAPERGTHTGDGLRVAAVFLGAAARAGDRVSIGEVALQAAMLIEAIAALRAAQGRRQEAEAATAAATSTRRAVDELARDATSPAAVALRDRVRQALEDQARLPGADGPDVPGRGGPALGR